MKRRVIIFCILFFLLSQNSAFSYWIWTPKTKKWINPKTAPKPTPKEQFDFALGFFNEKKYEDAGREFRKLLKAYPKSVEASESQYYLGRLEEEKGNLYRAYEMYQRLIDKYPFSERIQEIIERECKIAEDFMSGEAKRKALGITLPVENPSIEIFNKVIENSTYGPLAARAQYKLGLVLKSLTRYYEAEEAFNKVITNYPNSEWVEGARFQIASCRAAVSRGPDYDQEAMQEAKEKFEEFVKEHPDAVLSQKAEENLKELKDKEAESYYDIGRFYEKQRKYESAKIYYNDIIDNYPNSVWAAKATERLGMMEKEK